MPEYKYRITLQGSTPNDKTTLVYDLGNLADELAAYTAIAILQPALLAVTDALISLETLTSVVASQNTVPSDPAIDTFEELALSLHLNAPTEMQKLWTGRIPAPNPAILVPSGERGDITDANLIAYVDALATQTFVSDGEQIDVTSGDDGMNDTYKRTRAKTFRGK